MPITQSYEYRNALRRMNVKTEFVVYPDEGHDFFRHADQADVMARVVGWFNMFDPEHWQFKAIYRCGRCARCTWKVRNGSTNNELTVERVNVGLSLPIVN